MENAVSLVPPVVVTVSIEEIALRDLEVHPLP